jgi:hypothetical protein
MPESNNEPPARHHGPIRRQHAPQSASVPAARCTALLLAALAPPELGRHPEQHQKNQHRTVDQEAENCRISQKCGVNGGYAKDAETLQNVDFAHV